MLRFSSVLLLWPQIFSTTWQDPVVPLSCLTTSNTRVHLNNLVRYTIQDNSLFSAVRFLTIKGNTICSDPSSPWAIKAMKYLDAKKKPQSAHKSVTAAPGNTSTTHTKSAQRTQICFTPEKKQDYNNIQNLDIRGDTKQKTENEPDWTEGPTETTETFQLDGLGWEEDFDMGPGCLTTTTTKVPMKNLRSYTIQNKPLFPVHAVRFHTIGNTICSDPSSPWAIQAMKYLDAKKKPQLVSSTARQSVTAAPEKMSSINTKTALSSTTQVSSTPVKKQVYNYKQNLTDRGDTTPTKTGKKTELRIPVTTLKQDWRGSTETTETFQLDGLALEEEESTIMNEPFIYNYFCLKKEQDKYSGS